jgi:hypothetical protein
MYAILYFAAKTSSLHCHGDGYRYDVTANRFSETTPSGNQSFPDAKDDTLLDALVIPEKTS